MIKLNKQMLKGEKGITLTSLVIYIIVFVIIIAIMANISNYFYSNIGGIKDSPKYVAEFNKFSMFFIADVKRNTEIVTISEDSLQLADGTKYVYYLVCGWKANGKNLRKEKWDWNVTPGSRKVYL